MEGWCAGIHFVPPTSQVPRHCQYPSCPQPPNTRAVLAFIWLLGHIFGQLVGRSVGQTVGQLVSRSENCWAVRHSDRWTHRRTDGWMHGGVRQTDKILGLMVGRMVCWYSFCPPKLPNTEALPISILSPPPQYPSGAGIHLAARSDCWPVAQSDSRSVGRSDSWSVCKLVGRTVRLSDTWPDGQTDGQTDGRTQESDRRINPWTDNPKNGQTVGNLFGHCLHNHSPIVYNFHTRFVKT